MPVRVKWCPLTIVQSVGTPSPRGMSANVRARKNAESGYMPAARSFSRINLSNGNELRAWNKGWKLQKICVMKRSPKMSSRRVLDCGLVGFGSHQSTDMISVVKEVVIRKR